MDTGCFAGQSLLQYGKNMTRVELSIAGPQATFSVLRAAPVYVDMITGCSSGLIFGILHAIGPQNLGTLMTLSSMTTKGKAFIVGAACGLGHSFGMIVVAIAILAVQSMVTVSTEAWEYYGNYVIGASMILCALNFMMRETTYLLQHEDGSYTAQPCACHGSHHTTPLQGPKEPRLTSACASEEQKARHSPVPEQHDRTPHHEHVDVAQLSWDDRNARGACIGMLQGTCCPLVMVGVGFVATLHVAGIVAFIITFMAVTALGTAFCAMLWAWATHAGNRGCLSTKAAYRTSCCFTLSLGMLWVIANYYDILDELNYAEAAERANLYSLKHE
mmetsp:Transcript_91171/g.175532  ORF Transcript_91171/g.175532 Transcript_91171/m.175532 type:complete len:331 (+) Transcript_91171:83-1075(+)